MSVMHLLRFIYTLLVAIICIAAFITFLLLKNYPSAIFAFLAAILNVILGHLHLLNIKKTLSAWYDPVNLKEIGRLGLFCFAFGISALTYFAVIEIMLKKPIMPVEKSAIIPIVWSFIFLKCGLVLFFYARSYSQPPTEDNSNQIDNENSSLLPNN